MANEELNDHRLFFGTEVTRNEASEREFELSVIHRYLGLDTVVTVLAKSADQAVQAYEDANPNCMVVAASPAAQQRLELPTK